MLRLLLFFPIILLSQEIYLLPDDTYTLMNHYNTDIKSAKKEVFIFSARLDDYSLTAALKQLSKQNIPVNIISKLPIQDDNKISYLSLFENISIFTLKSLNSEEIRGSFICIDDEKYYIINNDLDKNRLKTIPSFASYNKGKCSYLFKILLHRSIPY